jgi:hypothetical protein
VRAKTSVNNDVDRFTVVSKLRTEQLDLWCTFVGRSFKSVNSFTSRTVHLG